MLVEVQQQIAPVKAFLAGSTPIEWLEVAAQHLDLLIQDHANCEKKAAATAMNLMFKYNDHFELQTKLAQLVREEMLHFEQVLGMMSDRGQGWKNVSASRYAAGLRKHVRTYEPEAFVDLMIVGAFVEARSCERFASLMPYVGDELAKYYRYLLKSESRHFEDYLSLAQSQSSIDITDRIEFFKKEEWLLISTPDSEIRFHSGIPNLD